MHWSDSVGGWIVTRYDDVLRTYLEVDTYSNEGRLARTMDHLPAEQRAELGVFADFYLAKGLVHADPPDHTRIRRLILKWGFTTGQVEALRPNVRRIVDDLLDRVEADGRMDVIEDLAFVLPVTVLCDLLGVPHSDGLFFRPLADRLLGFQGRNRPDFESLLAAQEAILELRALPRRAGRAPAGRNADRGRAARPDDRRPGDGRRADRGRARQHDRHAADRGPRDDDLARRQRPDDAPQPPGAVAGHARAPRR